MPLLDILIHIVVPLAMFVIMAIIGLDLNLADFKRIAQFPRAVLLGTISQMLTLPLLGAAIIALLPMEQVDIGTLIIFAACPGGGISNIMTAKAGGNVALSISYTTFYSLIGLVSIPIISTVGFQLFLNHEAGISLPVLPMIAQLTFMVLAPIALGMWATERYPTFIEQHRRHFNQLSNLLIFILIAMTLVADNGVTLEAMLRGLPAAVCFTLGSIVIGVIVASVSGLDTRDRIALIIEFSVRHAGIAALIIMVILDRFDMMALISSATIIQMLMIVLLAAILRFFSGRRSTL